MFEPRQAYNDLLNDSRLETLLSKAREQTVKVSGKSADELCQQAEALNTKSIEAVNSLNAILERKQAEREEKVATVIHLVEMAAKLVG